SSHVRTHGHPPTEPWEYGESFLQAFRQADNMRYELMPYIYTQAKLSTEQGLPMLRALFVEFPDDPGSWLVDDEYLFGSDLLVAPLFESVAERDVYLPPGDWIDYQTGLTYAGGWHTIAAGEIPVIVLVRSGSVIPHIGLAQSTQDLDWSQIELKVYATDRREPAFGQLYLPGAEGVKGLTVNPANRRLVQNPFGSQVTFSVSTNQ
ncbi:MAG: alpha-xylosidase, partial [Lewinella sp.]|nr:alpha-xylosidase [Lewinella sp.]